LKTDIFRDEILQNCNPASQTLGPEFSTINPEQVRVIFTDIGTKYAFKPKPKTLNLNQVEATFNEIGAKHQDVVAALEEELERYPNPKYS
jgi:hypothetical protein